MSTDQISVERDDAILEEITGLVENRRFFGVDYREIRKDLEWTAEQVALQISNAMMQQEAQVDWKSIDSDILRLQAWERLTDQMGLRPLAERSRELRMMVQTGAERLAEIVARESEPRDRRDRPTEPDTLSQIRAGLGLDYEWWENGEITNTEFRSRLNDLDARARALQNEQNAEHVRNLQSLIGMHRARVEPSDEQNAGVQKLPGTTPEKPLIATIDADLTLADSELDHGTISFLSWRERMFKLLDQAKQDKTERSPAWTRMTNEIVTRLLWSEERARERVQGTYARLQRRGV